MTKEDLKDEQATGEGCCADMFGMPEDCGPLGEDCLQMMAFTRSEQMPACCREMAARWRPAQPKEE